jgi:hypothetical protein
MNHGVSLRPGFFPEKNFGRWKIEKLRNGSLGKDDECLPEGLMFRALDITVYMADSSYIESCNGFSR